MSPRANQQTQIILMKSTQFKSNCVYCTQHNASHIPFLKTVLAPSETTERRIDLLAVSRIRLTMDQIEQP